jgi:hypothetical protein
LEVHEWRWPHASKINFSHLQLETTVHDWQGAQIALISFDELTHFTAFQFFYMVSRNRSTWASGPISGRRATRTRIAGLPSSWNGGSTTKPGFRSPSGPTSCATIFVIRVSDKFVWAVRPEDLLQYLPWPQDLPPGVDPPRPISVTFIPAKVLDNPLYCGSTQNISPGCCRCRCSSANGSCAAIGKSGDAGDDPRHLLDAAVGL